MAHTTHRLPLNARAPGVGKPNSQFGVLLMAVAFAALGTCTLGCAADTSTPGTKRLATAPTGLPWDGCTQVEGFVADAAGQFTVQSAQCNGTLQAWLLKRDNGSGGGEGGRPRVIDQLAVRALQAGETFSAGPYCRANQREIPWVAIYNWKKRKQITGRSGGIVEAWQADLQTGKLVPAPKSLIREAVCTANPDE